MAYLSGLVWSLPFHNFLQGALPQEVMKCSSENGHIWTPILLVYKAVELIFSLIFAFETRKVKVKELNDSKIIVLCVYTVVVSTIGIIPVIILLQSQPTILYAITGVVCLLTATALLTIIFVPKVPSCTDAILSTHTYLNFIYETQLQSNTAHTVSGHVPLLYSLLVHLFTPMCTSMIQCNVPFLYQIPCCRCTHYTKIPVERLTWTSPTLQLL